MNPLFFILFSILLAFPMTCHAKPKNSSKKEAALTQRIDAIIDSRLREVGFKASPAANELVLLRRLSLDLTGVTPQPESVINYRRLRKKKKLNLLIDKLIDSPRFADHMADGLIRSWIGWQRAPGYRGFKLWLVIQIKKNRAMDQIIQDILNPAGRGYGTGILQSLSQGQNTVMASDSARAFMGLQIGRAQCHDHPFSNWKQKQFHELAAYFTENDHIYETEEGFQAFTPRFPFKLALRRKVARTKKKRRQKDQPAWSNREVVSKLITHPKNP